MDVSPSARQFPDGRLLYRMLQRITETLAAELAAPGLPVPADWQDDDWCLARAVAAMQGIAPLLAQRSRWRGPGDWHAFLRSQHDHTAQRHLRLANLLRRVDDDARIAGVPLVALKGAELHRLGIYAPGERPMADIDLLVAEPHYHAAVGLIESLGFVGGVEGWKDHLFVERAALPRSLGEHHAHPLKVELHRRLVERLPWRLVSLPVRLLRDTACAGVNSYPSHGALMSHLLLHAAGAMPTRTLRMIQLHDIAQLASRMSTAGWGPVWHSSPREQPWWAYAVLRLASHYYDSIPAHALDASLACCPAALRRRAERTRVFDVSHSYPWVEAFPGLAWSRSFSERAQYIVNRIRPDRALLEKRRVVAVSEAWADRRWSSRPQWQRAWRYLGGPQGRPSTMYAVRLAFGAPS